MRAWRVTRPGEPGDVISDGLVDDLDRLGVSADRALFLDDAEPNVLGARAIGMQAHLHTDAPSTRAVIAALVPDLNPTATGVHA